MVLIVLIIEIAGVAVAWLFLDKAEAKLQTYLDSSLRSQYQANFSVNTDGSFTYSSGGDPLTLAWDIVQFQVCGNRSILFISHS